MSSEPIVTKEDNCWIVTLMSSGGGCQRYECATHDMAEHLVALLRQPPRPRPGRSHEQEEVRKRWTRRLRLA